MTTSASHSPPQQNPHPRFSHRSSKTPQQSSHQSQAGLIADPNKKLTYCGRQSARSSPTKPSPNRDLRIPPTNISPSKDKAHKSPTKVSPVRACGQIPTHGHCNRNEEFGRSPPKPGQNARISPRNDEQRRKSLKFVPPTKGSPEVQSAQQLTHLRTTYSSP